MESEKWFRIINDDLRDIPERVEELKSRYSQKTKISVVLIIVGCLLIGVGRWYAELGIFLAIIGVIGQAVLAVTCHTQLCLYRAVLEIRKHPGNHPEAGGQ